MAAQSAPTAAALSQEGNILRNRWVQLVAGIICMMMIANLQYGWTLFVEPINTTFGWSKAAIQVSFTIFVLVETWLVPFEAALVDYCTAKPRAAIGTWTDAFCRSHNHDFAFPTIDAKLAAAPFKE